MFSEKSTACIAQSAERNDTYLGLQNDAGTADGHHQENLRDLLFGFFAKKKLKS